MLQDMAIRLDMLYRRIRENERGQTLVEYGLIIGLVSVALVTALGTMTTALDGIFGAISTALDNAKAKIK